MGFSIAFISNDGIRENVQASNFRWNWFPSVVESREETIWIRLQTRGKCYDSKQEINNPNEGALKHQMSFWIFVGLVLKFFSRKQVGSWVSGVRRDRWAACWGRHVSGSARWRLQHHRPQKRKGVHCRQPSRSPGRQKSNAGCEASCFVDRGTFSTVFIEAVKVELRCPFSSIFYEILVAFSSRNCILSNPPMGCR